MSNIDPRLVEAWRTAAAELGISVVAPVEIGGETCVALLRDFGSPAGAVVVEVDGLRAEAATASAEAAGYFVSAMTAAAYERFDRELFVTTLDDWGWFGSGDAPPWYSGRAWGT